MRKLLSLFFVVLFLISMTCPAFGLDNRETAIKYLTEKYGVSKERIEIYEGGITEFEYTAESFWFARYVIVPEGKPLPVTSTGEKPLPATEPMPLPAPDMPSESGNGAMPVPPQDTTGNGYIYGDVYIRIKTGEILDMDKMEPFFTAENQLAQQEWERLRKEAGKIEVSLYKKLQGLPSSDKVSVSIQPAPVVTEDIKAQFEALKRKFPEQTSGMELPQILPYSFGYDLPAVEGSGASSSGSSSVYAGEPAVSYAVPESQVNTVPSTVVTDANILPARTDEKYMQDYNAMWERLEQILLQAVAPSLSTIKNSLDGMGATYKDNGFSIAADLTAEQISIIASLSAVSTVFEEAIFVALDSAKAQLAAGSAPYEMLSASREAAKDESPSSYLSLILIAAALLTAAFVIYRRQIKKRAI